MSATTVSLRRAGESGLSYVESLLEEGGLPSADVRSKPECFHVAYHGDERVGIGGLEVHGTDGILRSVVVDPAARGRGYGTAICEALEAEARESGVGTLYLLTTTAAGFFDDRGYEVIERGDAPATIRGTAQFDDLCPASATCMRKRLYSSP